MNSSYTVEAQLKATGVSQFQQAFANAEQSMSGFKKVGETMGNVGKKMTAGLTLPVAGLGVAALKVGMDFESGMSQVAATMNLTGKEGAKDLQMLEDKAREMGSTTKFSAGQASEGLNILAMSGMNARDSADTLEPVLKLAGAAGLELDEAAGIVTNTLGQFAMGVDDATRVTNVMARGASIANTDVSQLGQALEMAGSGANAMGYDVESSTAILAAFADEGLVGSQAGTAMNAMFRDMKNASEGGKVAVNGTKVAIADSNGEYREFTDIVDDLNDATDGLTDVQRDQALMTVFGDTAMKGYLKVTGDGIDTVKEYEASLRDSKDAASDMYEIMQDNLQGSIDNLKSAFEEAGISLSKVLIPMMEKVVAVVQSLIDKFNLLSDGQKETIVTIGLVVAAIGPLLLIGSKVIAGIGALSGVLVALMNPVTLVVGAIGGAILILKHFYETNETVREVVDAVWETIKSVITTVINAVSGVVTSVWGTLTDFWVENNELIGDTISTVWGAIQTTITTVIGIITPIVTGAWNAISTVTSGVWNTIKITISGVMNAILGIIKSVMQVINGDWRGAWNTMKTTVSGVINSVTSIIGSLGNINLFSAGKAIIGGLNKGLQDSFPDVQRTVSGMAGAIENSLTASPTMDIAGSVARSNAQVKSAVSHEINNKGAKQPAVLNIQLGKRNYRAFVEDISNAQSQNIQFETSYGL